MLCRLAATALLALGLATGAMAAPTTVVVRALSKDAKFIGDSMGGVEIVLRDAKTSRRLAQGLTAGGTGDTKRIVAEPRIRGRPIATPDAAAFVATLDLDRPTLVRAEATGPRGKPEASIAVSSTMWVLPGRAVDGDGWILEMPGLVVEPTWSQAPGSAASLTAKVTLMCGCPIEPGGLWDAASYEVSATVMKGDRAVKTVKLDYGGATSMFKATVADLPPGRYRLIVTAHNPSTGNTGVAERRVQVG